MQVVQKTKSIDAQRTKQKSILLW